MNELYRRLKASLETIIDDFEVIMVEDFGGDRSGLKEISLQEIE